MIHMLTGRGSLGKRVCFPLHVSLYCQIMTSPSALCIVCRTRICNTSSRVKHRVSSRSRNRNNKKRLEGAGSEVRAACSR